MEPSPPPATKFVVQRAVAAAPLCLLVSCGTQGEDPEPSDPGVVAPDRATGFEDVEAMCNDADAPPPATLDETSAWAKTSPRALCVDEIGSGIFIAQDMTDVELTDDQISALTPGEDVSEDTIALAEDIPTRIVVDGTVYEARSYYVGTDAGE